jgi:NTP pyrophosphatase (non-canonical NTP hydrolase)
MYFVTVSGFQRSNFRMYGKQNAIHYPNSSDIIIKMLRYWGHTVKGIRKKRMAVIMNDGAIMTSWSFALANHYQIDIEQGLWKYFPGMCPYCGALPCACPPDNKSERLNIVSNESLRPRSMTEYQSLLRRIYPKNTLGGSAMHLTEEMAEIAEAVQAFEKSQASDDLEEIRLELVDVFTNIFAVASCVGFDLAEAIQATFKDGCPRCGHQECDCGYSVSADSGVMHK